MIEMDMNNEPVSFPLAGKVLRVKRIGAIRRRGIRQACVIESMITEIRQKSAAIEDPKERGEYINRKIDALPSGDALADVVDNTATSLPVAVKAVCASLVDPLLSEQEVELLMIDSNEEECQALLAFIYGSKKK